MGATLSTRIEWGTGSQASSTSKQPPVGAHNQQVLLELSNFVNDVCALHPPESRVEFRKPLQWPTTLRPSIVSGADSSGLFRVVGGDGKSVKGLISSIATRGDGQPVLLVEEILSATSISSPNNGGSEDGRLFIAKCSSFEYLGKWLQLSGDGRLREIAEIVGANRDPLNIIFGIAGGLPTDDPGALMIAAAEALVSEPDAVKRDGLLKLFKLLLLAEAWDLKNLSVALKSAERDRNLDMHAIHSEIQLLQSFCGQEQRNALISIDWESDYVFANGYRAPPWRQVVGEMCYVELHPVDKEKVVAAGTKKGFYLIKGYEKGVQGKNDQSVGFLFETVAIQSFFLTDGTLRLNYEKTSDMFPNLLELLRWYSPHFNKTIDHQDYLYEPRLERRGLENASERGHVKEESDDEVPGGSPQANNAYKENKSFSKEPSKKSSSPADKKKQNAAAGPNDKKVSITATKPNEGPSLKWKALGLTEDPRPVRPKKSAHRSSGRSQDRREARNKAMKKFARQGSWEEDDYEETDSDGSSEEEVMEKRQENSELPAEYWAIQKLVKYLRVGNQTATIIAICALRDFDLSAETNQLAIRDVGGLDLLVNLLDTDDNKCKIGALEILRDVSDNVQIRQAVAELDGMQPLVELLKDSNEELKCLAAVTIAHCARNARNRRAVRRYGGIRKLVRLLKMTPGSSEKVAISGALALMTCSKSTKNKRAIQDAGAVPLLAALLESKNEDVLVPVVGILQECAEDENYRIAIRSSGMIKFLVEDLSSKNEELKKHAANAIFKCAEDAETRTLVRSYNGLDPLVKLLDNTANKELLAAATGAVWKCAQDLENVGVFNKLAAIKKLVGLMENQPEEVLVNVVGALGACAQTAEGRDAIRGAGGITPLVNLLRGTNQSLLVNVTTAVGACAKDADSMAIIDKLDGVRLLWSLLKSPNPQVQASAAWAISPCIEHAKDAGEMVRSFVGGLELIVSLLKSPDVQVLASVCAAIANIAKDEENLAVITDHGVVPMLAKLTNTKNDKLRKHLSEAVARCCRWGNNRVAFGTAGAVAPLVKYLKSPDEGVHRATAGALHQLSMDPDNCVTMHEHGVVQLLLGMVGSQDAALQEAAAGTIGNIRRLALASEKAGLV
ncbi:Armadillo repeat-containing protein 4 [Gonapodya sp. JEL0774]|nr:Armadillo repeat-containing protein 4 [Gonapodya sp. JEL0774]